MGSAYETVPFQLVPRKWLPMYNCLSLFSSDVSLGLCGKLSIPNMRVRKQVALRLKAASASCFLLFIYLSFLFSFVDFYAFPVSQGVFYDRSPPKIEATINFPIINFPSSNTATILQ